MPSESIEHFCTLFDSNFIPMGLALHRSLQKHHGKFLLWVICMDELSKAQIETMDLPDIKCISIEDIETAELLAVKKTRSRGEYCWTLTPFSFQAVFDRDPTVRRVTYLDADTFFFDNPDLLLCELSNSGRHVLYTEHAYAPEYDQSKISGKYCVQFLCIANTIEGRKVMSWWQDRCLEWCYDRVDVDRFGDQKYLDQWEKIFPNETLVVAQKEKTLAPWNVAHFYSKVGHYYLPVLYHFHSFRIVKPNRARLFTNYKIGSIGMRLYEEYLHTLTEIRNEMAHRGFPFPCMAKIRRRIPFLSMIKKVYIQRNEKYQQF